MILFILQQAEQNTIVTANVAKLKEIFLQSIFQRWEIENYAADAERLNRRKARGKYNEIV